jgi:integrase
MEQCALMLKMCRNGYYPVKMLSRHIIVLPDWRLSGKEEKEAMSLYERKDSETWWVSIVVNGRRLRISTGTENKKLAEKIHAKVLVDIEEGRYFDNQSKRRTLKEMIDRYEREYTDHKDYYSKARDKSIFKNLYVFFGQDTTLQEVENLIGGYENHRKGQLTNRRQPPSPASVLKELATLRRMFNIARKQWKWKVANPVSEIELPKVRNERVRYLEAAEYTRLLNVLNSEELSEEWLKPFVVIAIDTGLRLTNLCELRWSEINLFSRMIVIAAEKMKNDDYIGIPLTDGAFQTLKELQKIKCLSGHVFHDNGQPLYDRKVQRAFRKALKKAEIADFHFHDLRHTFASYLRQKGVDLHTIGTLLGHKDLRMTKRYAHLNVDALKEAVSKLCHVSVTVEDNEMATRAVTP